METMTQDAVFVSGKVETPRHFAQLILPVLDGSGSMTEQARGNITKAQATNIALRELLTRIKISGVAQNFTCGVLTFDHAVKERLATRATAVARVSSSPSRRRSVSSTASCSRRRRVAFRMRPSSC